MWSSVQRWTVECLPSTATGSNHLTRVGTEAAEEASTTEIRLGGLARLCALFFFFLASKMRGPSTLPFWTGVIDQLMVYISLCTLG